MARRLRPSFVVTVATFGASITASGCTTRCPESADSVHAGDPCSGSRACKLKEGCGLNGWRCENGQWREIMTYCNPPPPQPPPQPSATDGAATTASATAPTATAAPVGAAPTTTAAPIATAPIATTTPVATGAAAACPKPIAASQPCSLEGQRCETRGGCGFNGWRCEQGRWKEMRTFC